MRLLCCQSPVESRHSHLFKDIAKHPVGIWSWVCSIIGVFRSSSVLKKAREIVKERAARLLLFEFGRRLVREGRGGTRAKERVILGATSWIGQYVVSIGYRLLPRVSTDPEPHGSIWHSQISRSPFGDLGVSHYQVVGRGVS